MSYLRTSSDQMAIVEDIVLDDVRERDYELSALPHKLAGLDTKPLRVVLREL